MIMDLNHGSNDYGFESLNHGLSYVYQTATYYPLLYLRSNMEILESIPENPEVEDLKYQSITYRVPAWSWRLKYQKLFYISVLRAKPPWKGYNYREEKKSNKLVLIHRQESKFFFSYITMAVYKCRSGSEIWAYHLEQKEEKITWRIELVNDTQGNQKTKTCTKDKQKKKEKREGGGGGVASKLLLPILSKICLICIGETRLELSPLISTPCSHL